MHRSGNHLSAARLALAAVAIATIVMASPGRPAADGSAQQQPAPAAGPARFMVLLRGVRVGTEQVDLSRTPGGLKIAASGQLSAPFDLITHKFELTYSSDWQPQALTIDASLSGQPLTLSTTFGLTTATSEMVQGTQRGSVTHDVSPRTVVLPRNVFGAYEVLAARIAALQAGAKVPVYFAPDREVSATIDRVADRHLSGPTGQTTLKEFDLTVPQARGTATLQLWIDDRQRLARLSIPAASLIVIRDDISSVMVREEKVRHPGDEDVFIPASGFNIAATLTRPSAPAGRHPVVILVGGPGQQDRDEVLYGLPLFGQIAGALADAGYLTVRYDKRGVGQSGGRTEYAGLDEYAQDVRAIVNWVRRRQDADGNRIAVAGHAEGAAVALLAAGREGRIRALALLSAPGASGRDVTMEQQQRALAGIEQGDADRQAKIDLQRRIVDAALAGGSWEGIPPEIQRQADTPWFRSWLRFDPASAIRRTDASILILHGSLDTQMPVQYASRLEALSLARDRDHPERTAKVVLEGVNHLLMPATTGDVEEYAALDKRIAPGVTAALIAWLNRVWTATRLPSDRE